jgi:hypothetical protein
VEKPARGRQARARPGCPGLVSELALGGKAG